MRGVVALACAAALLGAAPLPSAVPSALSPLAAATPLDAGAILAKMLERNPTLRSYRSRVHVDVRMLNFPFLAPKLDGTSYYRRPDTYEVVFDRVPPYAKGFSRLFDDVGDPAAWKKDERIAYQGTQRLNGRRVFVLRLTKQPHSDVLDHSLAYVDAQTYALAQMEWDYTNGGKIVMQQTYGLKDGYSVLTAQHATIDIPHVHAIADATYSRYRTNVAVTMPATP